MLTIVTSLIGATLLAYGLQRYAGILNTGLGVMPAVILIVFSLLLIIPGVMTDVVGISGSLLVFLFVYFRKKKSGDEA